jgi:trans-aconitate 2-methyltransferase
LPSWDANLYLRFARERTQPAIDLISRIALPEPKRIVDLGCGPGNSTAMLRERWPAAEVTGLDNSREMIVAASQAHPDWIWIAHDIATWKAAAPFDLVFSNAALHWVPNHRELMPRLLMQAGSQEGVLAVQMPAHFQSPVHELMLEIAHNGAWRHEMLAAVQAIKVERPAFYYDVLQPHVSKLDLWETEYIHLMDSPAAILEWMRGTGLRPFLEALNSAQQKCRFEQLFLAGLKTAYPPQKDGRILFPFRRLFLVAYR